MASSGSFNTNGYNGRYLQFSWYTKSQSIANNQTTITWSLTGQGQASASWYNAGNFYVSIAGNVVYSSSTRIKLYNGTVVATGDFTLYHDAQGQCTFSAYAQAGIYTVAVNCTGEGTWSVDAIPRQANITSAPNFTDIESPTITYNNPAGNNVTSLQARIENSTGTSTYIEYRDISKTGTSYTFNFTDAERNTLRNLTPNSNTLTVRFVIKTVIGGNTFWSTANRTLTIVNANPTVATLTYADTNATTTAVTLNNQILVQKLSTPQFTLTNINALKGATLREFYINIGNITIGTGYFPNNTTVGDASHYDTLYINCSALNYSNNQTATLYVKDSRGNTLKQDIALTFASWQNPSAIIDVYRHNNFYSETDINVNADISSVDGKNQLTILYAYKKTTDSTYSADATLQDEVTTTITLDNLYEWNLRVKVQDSFATTTYNLIVQKGVPIIYFDKNLNATGFNCFPLTQDGVWSSDFPMDDAIYVGSQVLYDNFKSTTAGSTKLLGAYNYQLIEGIFDGMTIPSAYEKAYKISAQLSTTGDNYSYVALNNFQSKPQITWSAPTFRCVTATRIFKQSEIELQDVFGYETATRKGCNIIATNGNSNSGNTNYTVEFWNITLHGYLVKKTTNLETIGSYINRDIETNPNKAKRITLNQFAIDYPNKDATNYTYEISQEVPNLPGYIVSMVDPNSTFWINYYTDIIAETSEIIGVSS